MLLPPPNNSVVAAADTAGASHCAASANDANSAWKIIKNKVREVKVCCNFCEVYKPTVPQC